MSKYDTEYYFILWDEQNRNQPFLKPDMDTVNRRYYSQAQEVGSPPFVFTNGFKGRFAKEKIKEELSGVLFGAANFIVSESIRTSLLDLDVPNLRVHPAIYIDDLGERHEEYWYIGFCHYFDCWDRDSSRFRGQFDDDDEDDDDDDDGDDDDAHVESYSLNAEILDNTPLRDRLLFQMGGTDDALVVCHHSISKLFSNGARLKLVADYGVPPD